MQTIQNSNFQINEIIDREQVVSHFQPIVSVKKRKVVGVEALIRGVSSIDNTLIPPSVLFPLAEGADLTLEFDRLCRKEAIRSLCMTLAKLFQGKNGRILVLCIDIAIRHKTN